MENFIFCKVRFVFIFHRCQLELMTDKLNTLADQNGVFLKEVYISETTKFYLIQCYRKRAKQSKFRNLKFWSNFETCLIQNTLNETYDRMFSRMDQVKYVEDSL